MRSGSKCLTRGHPARSCSSGSLTPTEQFLSQVCNAQNARFNGNSINSSLLQNSGGKADNALICCIACLDSVRLASPFHHSHMLCALQSADKVCSSRAVLSRSDQVGSGLWTD
jgi:hypothetical protein